MKSIVALPSLMVLFFMQNLNAQVQKAAPPSPPKATYAKAEKKEGKVLVYYNEFEQVWADEKYTFTPPGGGAAKEGIRKVMKTVTVSKVVNLADNKHATFIDASGKKLTEEDLLNRLKESSPIFIFDRKAEDFYLKAIKPDTVILVFGAVAPKEVPTSNPK